MSQKQINPPVVYEVHGGRSPKQIDAYIARDQLAQGYHGVQVKELALQREEGGLLIDWNGYEWFGNLNWMRPNRSNDQFYVAGYALAVPESKWESLKNKEFCQDCGEFSPEIRAKYETFISALQRKTDNAVIPSRKAEVNPFNDLLTRISMSFPNGIHFSQLAHTGDKSDNWRELTKWALPYIVPCETDDAGKHYMCNTRMSGVIIYKSYTGGFNSSPQVIGQQASHIFNINGTVFDAFNNHAHFYDARERMLYTTDDLMGGFIR